jgi:hypothetical protein
MRKFPEISRSSFLASPSLSTPSGFLEPMLAASTSLSALRGPHSPVLLNFTPALPAVLLEKRDDLLHQVRL